MDHIATLESRSGLQTSVSFDGGRLEPLVRQGMVDAYIVATEDGFSPLGMNLRFLSDDLGVPITEIKDLANWNRFHNQRVTLVAIPSRNKDGRLRGVILAASETSECYRRFATPLYGRPYRDFYYNVTFQAIAYACENWGTHQFALSHLSGSGRFHEDIATCNVEALAHFCDTQKHPIDSFVFLGCCILPTHLQGISRLNTEGYAGKHRSISTEIEGHSRHIRIHLDWPTDVQNVN
jgi:hypothetical protein